MTDQTTDGYTVTDAEIDGMVRNLCAYALGEPDPLERYAGLSHQQVLFDGVVAAIQRERGRALADLIVSGIPVAEVVAKTNLTTAAQVNKLVKAAGEAERVKAATARKPGAKARPAAKEPDPVPEPVLPQISAASGKRVLTAAELMALGLPADGSVPRARSHADEAGRAASGERVAKPRVRRPRAAHATRKDPQDAV
jgi:hypothetical protein